MAFDQLLRRRQDWDCTYALDLTDVRVLALPPCAALGGALVLASDDATDEASIKKWLRYKANATNFNQVWSEQARSFSHHGPGPLHKFRTRLELRGGQPVRAPALWHPHPRHPVTGGSGTAGSSAGRGTSLARRSQTSRSACSRTGRDGPT